MERDGPQDLLRQRQLAASFSGQSFSASNAPALAEAPRRKLASYGGQSFSASNSASYVYTEQAYLDDNGVWQTLSWSVTEGRIDETSREFTAPSVCEPCQVSVSDGNGWGRTYGGRLGVLAFAFRGTK